MIFCLSVRCLQNFQFLLSQSKPEHSEVNQRTRDITMLKKKLNFRKNSLSKKSFGKNQLHRRESAYLYCKVYRPVLFGSAATLSSADQDCLNKTRKVINVVNMTLSNGFYSDRVGQWLFRGMTILISKLVVHSKLFVVWLKSIRQTIREINITLGCTNVDWLGKIRNWLKLVEPKQ